MLPSQTWVLCPAGCLGLAGVGVGWMGGGDGLVLRHALLPGLPPRWLPCIHAVPGSGTLVWRPQPPARPHGLLRTLCPLCTLVQDLVMPLKADKSHSIKGIPEGYWVGMAGRGWAGGNTGRRVALPPGWVLPAPRRGGGA